MREVTITFAGWTPSQKVEAAQELIDLEGAAISKLFGHQGGASSAWDIIPLYDKGAGRGNALAGDNGYAYRCGGGKWMGTVAINKRCYYAGAVNYALWGKMNRLCYEYFSVFPTGWPADCWNNWSLEAAKRNATLWKHVRYHDYGETAKEAREFTVYGFNGTLPSSSLPCRYSGEVVDAHAFDWCWEPCKPRKGDISNFR